MNNSTRRQGYKVSCVQKYWRWCIMLQILFINQVFFGQKTKFSAWPDYPGSKDYPSHLLKISTSIQLYIYFSMHIADHAGAFGENNKFKDWWIFSTIHMMFWFEIPSLNVPTDFCKIFICYHVYFLSADWKVDADSPPEPSSSSGSNWDD